MHLVFKVSQARPVLLVPLALLVKMAARAPPAKLAIRVLKVMTEFQAVMAQLDLTVNKELRASLARKVRTVPRARMEPLALQVRQVLAALPAL